MAVITKENVNPAIIKNTTMQRVFRDGVHTVYYITPNAGYVLHDKDYDFPDESGTMILGYRTTTASCRHDYDFATNLNEFYTVPETDAPADRIF